MLVLASASPRRQEILRNAGIPFTVHSANIPEDPLPGEEARSCAERLAQEKATAIARVHPGEPVLGADTVVVVEGKLLGKPVDQDDAGRMLRLLSGKTHEVITGVCLAFPAPEPAEQSFHAFKTCSERTLVTMAPLSPREIDQYAGSDEPMDKAGAYAIQGMASRWVSRIEGDYFNVVGLPVSLVYRMLCRHLPAL